MADQVGAPGSDLWQAQARLVRQHFMEQLVNGPSTASASKEAVGDRRHHISAIAAQERRSQSRNVVRTLVTVDS